nr:choice-of-anchor D domain-containing protein [uncultured Dyadobacter sp.]
MTRTILASVISGKAALRRLVMLLPVLLLVVSGVQAQTQWNGSTDTDWNNAANWSGGVPGTGTDVIIADGPNAPVISGTISAAAKSVLVQPSGSLTIQASGSLTINGSAAYTSPASFSTALNNLGTIANSGSIVLGSVSDVGTHGIVNQQTFNNTASGSIEINHWVNTGIYNASGTFTNDGGIALGNGTGVGQHGIWNDGTFQNNGAGTIHIDRTSLIGLMNNFNPAGAGAATFNNSGSIVIGSLFSAGNYGLENLGNFDNASGGHISIDRSALAGLYNAAGTFANGGVVTIGAIAAVGTNGVQNEATMTIGECGRLLLLAGNLSNSALKTITNTGLVQISNNLANFGTFTNNGVLKYGSFSEPYINNYLVVRDAPGPIFSYGGNFSGIVNGIYTDAGATQSAGTFTAPNQFVAEGLTDGSHTLYARITPQSAACSYIVPFTYSYTAPGPDINVKGNNTSITNGDSSPNTSKGTDFGSVYTAAGNAVRTFTIENKGDQALALTGTPAVSLTGSADFTVTAQPATAIAAGETTQVEITFDPGSAGAKTAVVSIASNDANENPYTFTITGAGSDVCVPIATPTGPLTWTGLTDTDWNKPCNWSPASVPAKDNDVIIPAAVNAPVIGDGIAARVKTVEVQTGATLTIAATAALTVEGVKTVSGSETILYNAGTVQNNGQLTLGKPSLTADLGLRNSGNFMNGQCGRVIIVSGDLKNDLSKTITNTGLTLITHALVNDGTFTNDGTLKYGSITGTITNNQVIIHDKPEPIFTLGSGFSATIDGIFKDNGATLSAGTFTAPDNFIPDPSLGIGSHTLYAKVTPPGDACSYIVSFEYEFLTNHTTWTGTVSSDWNNAANWTPRIPDIYTEAIIPDVSTHAPIIGNGQSMVAYAVRVETGSSLSISSGGTLTINGHSTYTAPFDFTAGFNNKGTVNNSGQLVVGSNAGVGTYAVVNQGIFNNLPGADIRIDSTSDTGLFNASGIFTNNANITIGGNSPVGLHGIWNDAVFNNNIGGMISIDRSSAKALMNNADETKSIHATFTNAAGITIGAVASAGTNGIHNTGTFNNNAGGDIHVDNTIRTAIYHDVHTFTNAAGITIGSAAATGNTGLETWGHFVNAAGASLKVDRVVNFGISIGADTLVNDGSIILGATSKPGMTGLLNAKATFLNGGTVSVDRTGNQGMETNGVTVNDGTITIGSSEAVGHFGLFVSGTFNNNTGAVIRIDRVSGSLSALPTGLRHQVGAFSNSGAIVIGEAVSGGDYGMRLQATFTNHAGGTINIDRTNLTAIDNASTFTNTSNITIGALAPVGKYGIDIAGPFNNNAGGNIKIDQTTEAAIFVKSTFSNVADITIGGSASVGKYGIETAVSGNFSNAAGGKIAIDRSTSIAIVHLGDTFNNESEITIGGVAGAGIYGISNQKVFKNNPGGHIRIDRTTDTGIYQLKGTFSNAADITIGANAEVGVHGIFTETVFDNNAGGNIRIDRTSLAGLRVFNGTFTNAADLIIGSVEDVGTYGIQNQSFLINNTGGNIRIDRTKDTGIYQFKGKFTNAASINIGANANTGVHGIFNESDFVNNAGGDIRIDRTTLAALRNFNGAFTNAAAITIGSVASVGTYGIRNSTAFSNNAGGDIRVDNAQQGIFLEGNTFNNAGAVTIGGVNAIASLLTQQGTGSFSNNADGIFKATGQISTAAFVHAGGALSPGYSPGKLTFSDNQDFSNSTMNIEMNGTGTAGVNFDQVAVTGTAALGGTLALSINFTPIEGDEVTILTATAVSGEFSSISGLAQNWFVIYSPTSVKLLYSPAMPVHLVAFTARAAGPVIQLQWRTVSETDNAGFHIERSNNGTQWEDIGFVDGNATTSQMKEYAFTDENPMPGLNYYRLRQTDFDGKTEHSRVQAIRYENQDKNLVVWADAARRAHVRTDDTIEQIIVFNLSGRIVAVSKTATVDLSGIPAGILVVQVRTNRGLINRKLPLM